MAAHKGNNYAKGNKGGGRITTYQPDYAAIAERLCKLGATDKELAEAFDVSEQTINNWKKDEEFALALKKGKIIADAHVADSLYKRATGYEHEDVDIKMYEGQIIETKLTKHYPPDPTSMIFWLKNRRSKEWRDKQEGESVVTINQMIVITRDEQTKEELKNLR